MGYYAFSWVNKTFPTGRFPGVSHVQPDPGADAWTPSRCRPRGRPRAPGHSALGFRRICGLDKVVLGRLRVGQERRRKRQREWRRERKARRPVSRVLSTPRGDRWPFIWDARYRTPRATYPGGGAKTRLPAPISMRSGVSPLFGLAPGGVYHAASVAGGAVRSYRTLSPLPRAGAR